MTMYTGYGGPKDQFQPSAQQPQPGMQSGMGMPSPGSSGVASRFIPAIQGQGGGMGGKSSPAPSMAPPGGPPSMGPPGPPPGGPTGPPPSMTPDYALGAPRPQLPSTQLRPLGTSSQMIVNMLRNRGQRG